MNRFFRINKLKLPVIFMLVASLNLWANETVRGTTVVQLGAYQDHTTHFVWLASGVVSACSTNPTYHFDENQPGGKSLVSILTAALIAKTPVDVRVNGCRIEEVYLKANP